MFDSFDRDRDGRIDATELGRALAHYQYANSSTLLTSFITSALPRIRVAPHILVMLVKKYGKSGSQSVTSPWSYMNSPSINRVDTVTESATCLW